MAFSDALFDAAEGIRDYLREPVFNRTITEEQRARIVNLLAEMDDLRRELDGPPQPAESDS
jgi:hypothetical protein